MRIGVIGDDFTGSGDVANTLAKAGANTVQTVGIPDGSPPTDVEAVVVSLKSRSIPAADAVAQSLAACRWLVAEGAEQILFKYCSTFNSTPDGNIGPVAAALLAEIDAPVALVCPAFPANGRTVYQGHLFVGDRLLNESGMEQHPLNPMTDADVRRWLARQTELSVGHLPLPAVRGEVQKALETLEANGSRLIVADAIANSDLLVLGRAARNHRLVTGGSGIAMGLPANFGIAPRAPERYRGMDGPGIVLSGSCSAATAKQVDAYRAVRPALKIEASEALDTEGALARIVAFMDMNRSEEPLVYSTEDPKAVAAAQARFGRATLASRYDILFAEIARAAVARGFRRIVAAGGETSGAVAGALGCSAFAIGPEIDTGVPALTTTSGPGLALALKSGNFGSSDFFARALHVLSGKGLPDTE